MNARPPISVLGSVTFATKPIALGEFDQLAVVKPEFITISCIMAIEAPSHCFGMEELDLGMLIF